MHQNFKYSTKLNMMVKVIKLFTGVLGKRSPDNFIGKHLWRTLFLNKVSPLHAKQRLLHRCFTSTSARKHVSLDLIFSFLLFLFQKRQKQPPEMFCEKNVFPQVSQIRKHLSWGLFLIKLEVFQNTYFEEHLWTNAS